MKKILITVMSVAFMNLVSLAQDVDSTRANTSNQSSQKATDKSNSQNVDGAQPENNQSNENESQDNSEGSSPTNQAIPVPQGGPAILDGTNAIPIDSSKRAGHHYKDDAVKDGKKKAKAKKP